MKKILSLCFVAVLVLSSCTQTTKGAWEKPFYTDEITQFLISEDAKKVVFVGDEYHYIFATTQPLIDVLTWKERKSLKASFPDKFKLNGNNEIVGKIVIRSDFSTDKKKNTWLEEHGFKRLTNPYYDMYILPIDISGERFLSNGVEIKQGSNLNQTYKVKIETDRTLASTLSSIALTPIAVTFDGVATIGLASLFVVAIPFVAINEVVGYAPKVFGDN